MRLTTQILLTIVACFVWLTTPRALHACAVCVELPEASLADHILSAEIIVLARPAPDNPFRFSVKKILRGTESQLRTIPEIPFLIDSVTRRALQSNPERTYLLTYGATYNGRAGRSFSKGWKRIFIMSPDRRQFVETLRSLGAHWTFGLTDTSDRVSFFAEYLWHPDHALHNAAMVEIDRAPYALVRPVADRHATIQIMQEFNTLNRFRYLPVAIRLLGLQTDSQAGLIVRSRYTKALKAGGPFVYEWALAGIESDGAIAISAIKRSIQDPGKTLEFKRSLIQALSEAGTSHPEYRDKIVAIFSDTLERDRRLAMQIALASRKWGRSDLQPQFETIVAEPNTDPATQFVLKLALDSELNLD